MLDYHARSIFRVLRQEHEIKRAELNCYVLIAEYLINLNHTKYNVTYSSKIIPHEFDETLNYVQIDAVIVIDGGK